MHRRRMRVILERDHANPLGGMNQLDDAYRGAQRSGDKRGRDAQYALFDQRERFTA